MNATFWGRMSEEYLKENPELPPLSDETLAAFEKRMGLKLPKALTDLLRIKNGGPLVNTDFRFDSKDYQVTYFKSVSPSDSYASISSYASILGDSENAETRDQLQKKVGNLAKVVLVAEPLDHHYAFALNYNRLNSNGEPTIVCVARSYEEEAEVDQIADSFADFLAGQYAGDERPAVNLNESQKYQLIAEGGFDGRYEGTPEPGLLSGLPVRVRWKICSAKSRLIVFQDVDWGGQLEITREVIPKSALTFDFPSLESYGVELEADLAEMIRPAVEIEVLSKYEAPLIPDCYELLLHIQPGGKKWVSIDSSSPYQGRWKNSKSEVVYSSLKSSNKADLIRTLQAVAASCSGLRRFLG